MTWHRPERRKSIGFAPFLYDFKRLAVAQATPSKRLQDAIDAAKCELFSSSLFQSWLACLCSKSDTYIAPG